MGYTEFGISAGMEGSWKVVCTKGEKTILLRVWTLCEQQGKVQVLGAKNYHDSNVQIHQ